MCHINDVHPKLREEEGTFIPLDDQWSATSEINNNNQIEIYLCRENVLQIRLVMFPILYFAIKLVPRTVGVFDLPVPNKFIVGADFGRGNSTGNEIFSGIELLGRRQFVWNKMWVSQCRVWSVIRNKSSLFRISFVVKFNPNLRKSLGIFRSE